MVWFPLGLEFNVSILLTSCDDVLIQTMEFVEDMKEDEKVLIFTSRKIT